MNFFLSPWHFQYGSHTVQHFTNQILNIVIANNESKSSMLYDIIFWGHSSRESDLHRSLSPIASSNYISSSYSIKLLVPFLCELRIFFVRVSVCVFFSTITTTFLGGTVLLSIQWGVGMPALTVN